MKTLKIILISLLVIILGLYVYLTSMTPSLNRNWTEDQKILADIEINEQSISIKNIRDFRYSSSEEYEANYYNGAYNIEDISSLDYIIEPFGDIDGLAHTMMSFGFADGRHLTVSSEIRKEVGESFHPVSGLLNTYEIVYVIGDEQDLIKLRANHRKNTVRLYPIRAEKEELQKLFVSVMQRAKSLSEEPEFYNSLTNNCTTSILTHLNTLRAENGKSSVPWSKKIMLPAHSDKLAYELGLIDTQLTLEEAREYYTITPLSQTHEEGQDYSQLIRKEIR